jgi:membrane-associated phospholipid phosphatase
VSRVSEAARPNVLRRWAGGPPRLLLSPGFRRPAWILIVACAVITAVLGAAFAGQARPDRLDRVIDDRMRSALLGYGGLLHPVADWAPLVVIVAGVAGFVAFLLARRPRAAALLAIALPGGLLAEQTLKPLVGRTLSGDGWSYPSGHTIGAFSLAVCVLVLLLGPHRPPLRPAVRALLAGAVLVIACVVPPALVTLRMHYFTDTVGGAALATALVLAAALLIDAIGPSTRRRMLGKDHDRTDSA